MNKATSKDLKHDVIESSVNDTTTPNNNNKDVSDVVVVECSLHHNILSLLNSINDNVVELSTNDIYNILNLLNSRPKHIEKMLYHLYSTTPSWLKEWSKHYHVDPMLIQRTLPKIEKYFIDKVNGQDEAVQRELKRMKLSGSKIPRSSIIFYQLKPFWKEEGRNLLLGYLSGRLNEHEKSHVKCFERRYSSRTKDILKEDLEQQYWSKRKEWFLRVKQRDPYKRDNTRKKVLVEFIMEETSSYVKKRLIQDYEKEFGKFNVPSSASQGKNPGLGGLSPNAETGEASGAPLSSNNQEGVLDG